MSNDWFNFIDEDQTGYSLYDKYMASGYSSLFTFDEWVQKKSVSSVPSTSELINGFSKQ
jgi:hypothetical protein